MSQAKYQKIDAGIEHLSSHVIDAEERGVIARRVHYIETGTGDPAVCASMLGDLSLARAMLAWFGERDLASFKQRMFESAKLEAITYLLRPSWKFSELVCLAPLLCDCKSVLDWYRSADRVRPSPPDTDNPKSHAFRWMQMLHALCGEWDILGERAQMVIAISPPSQKKFMVDHRFYLALAQGDVAAMESALAELTSEKMARVRNDELSFGYTHFFIGTHAVIYAKLAWIRGFEVRVDSPYVPAEWLPVRPLPSYSDPYEFMAKFPV